MRSLSYGRVTGGRVPKEYDKLDITYLYGDLDVLPLAERAWRKGALSGAEVSG
jgi:hypothetical protein